MLIEPKEITVTDSNGAEHQYTIGKFPAVAGREILAKYPLSNAPKLADYGVSQDVMLKLMNHVTKRLSDGREIRLSTAALVDNHVPDAEALLRIEMASLGYNVSFFSNAGVKNFRDYLLTQAESLIQSIMTTPMGSSLLSSLQDSQRTANSKKK